MRAFHWRLAAALLPLGLAIAACADPSLTGRKGAVILTQRGTKSNVVVTRPDTSTTTTGDGGVVQRSGVTGVTVTRPTATTNPTTPPVYQTFVNLTINGKAPKDWHDWRIYQDKKIAYLVSESELPSLGSQVPSDGRFTYNTFDPGMYHFVYNDGNLFGIPDRDALGYQRLDMLGFFVSPYVIFDGNTDTTKTLNVDLYWDTQAEPAYWDAGANDPRVPRLYTTYTDDRFRTKPFQNSFVDSLPLYLQDCKYRFVVARTPGGEVVWQSAWHQIEPPRQFVEVQWNGYSSQNSGPDDDPPEESRYRLQDDTTYFYCIEFYPSKGEAPKEEYRTVTTHGASFVRNYYGASQWFEFKLKHGVKPTPSPGPGASPSPSPSPRPTTTPTPDPFATPTPPVFTF